MLAKYGATSEYPATIVLDLTAHVFLKNKECAGINYREWPGILTNKINVHFNSILAGGATLNMYI